MTTSRSAVFGFFTNLLTAVPDLFIKVSGATSATTIFSSIPVEIVEWDFLSLCQPLNLLAFAKYSSAMRPVLCRVFAYSSPGFPNPTITHAMAIQRITFFLHHRETPRTLPFVESTYPQVVVQHRKALDVNVPAHSTIVAHARSSDAK